MRRRESRPEGFTDAEPPGTLPASLKLVDAATASGDISYRLRLTTSSHRYEGAFDPKTSTGYVRVANEAGILTELLIGGTRSIGTEPPARGPTPSGTHEAYSRYGQCEGKSDFQYGEKRADGSSTTTGDVTLDTAGRIAKVATKVTWQSTAKGRLDTGTYGTTLELTDYGVPVKVTAN